MIQRKSQFYLVRYVYAGFPYYKMFDRWLDVKAFLNEMPGMVSSWSIHELKEQSPFKTSQENYLPSTNIVVEYESGGHHVINGYSPDNIGCALKDINFSDVKEIKIRIV